MPGLKLPSAAFGSPGDGTIGIDENGDLVFRKASVTKYVVATVTPTITAFDMLSTLTATPYAVSAPEVLAASKLGGWVDASFTTDGILVLPTPSNGKVIGVRVPRTGAAGMSTKTIVRPSTQVYQGTGPSNTTITAVVAQPDGKVLVGGTFSTWSGVAVENLIRLNADGSLDTSFNTTIPASSAAPNAIALDASGNIYYDHGTTIRKVSSSGTADATFNSAVGTADNNGVEAIVVLSDGTVIVGGDFTNGWGGNTTGCIVKFSTAGVQDTTFLTNVGNGAPSGIVYALAKNSSDDIFVGGTFTTFNSTARNRLVKLSSAGVVDGTFYTNHGTGAFNSTVFSLAVQTDGEILVLGAFTTIGGVTYNKFARLNTNGTVDSTHYTNTGGAASTFDTAVSTRLSVALDSSNAAFIWGRIATTDNGPSYNIGYAMKFASSGTRDLNYFRFTGGPAGCAAISTTPTANVGSMGKCAVDSNGYLIICGEYELIQNSSTGVKALTRIPASSTEFFSVTLLPGNSVVLRCTATGYVMVSADLATGMVPGGQINFVAVTTNPTKGTASNTDKLCWARNGCMVTQRLDYVQTAAGTAGSGDYAFPLVFEANTYHYDAGFAVDTMAAAVGRGMIDGLQAAVGLRNSTQAYVETDTDIWGSSYLPFSNTTKYVSLELSYIALDM
jgi:uncharacterized delta-60 repeat protein